MLSVNAKVRTGSISVIVSEAYDENEFHTATFSTRAYEMNKEARYASKFLGRNAIDHLKAMEEPIANDPDLYEDNKDEAKMFADARAFIREHRHWSSRVEVEGRDKAGNDLFFWDGEGDVSVIE